MEPGTWNKSYQLPPPPPPPPPPAPPPPPKPLPPLPPGVLAIDEPMLELKPDRFEEKAAALKAALTNLDEATRPLADRMMDKAMEAALRKRGVIQ